MFTDDQLTDDLFLGGKIKLLQPKEGYRAGTDPVLLAAACPAKAGQSVLELGCGAGTALLCLKSRVAIRAFGVERLSDYASLARMNFARNGMDATIETADLMRVPPNIRDQGFDHVIVNPPFFRGGREANDIGRASGRQEDTPLQDWIDQALRRTKPKGHVTLIHLTERLSELISYLAPRAGDIEIRPLAGRERRLAKRIILVARKGSSGGTTLHNPLILHAGLDHDGDKDSFTPEAKDILLHGRALNF